MNEWLSISQAAQVLGVTPDTVRAWERQGRLRAERTEGEHRRFRSEEVHRLAATAGRPVAERDQPRRGPMRTQSPLADVAEESDISRHELREARTRVEILKAEDQAGQIIGARQAEERRRDEDAAQRQRHDELRRFGRTLAVQAGLPANWRAELTEELERYVTTDRFPASLPTDEARDFVRARVDSIVERAAAERREAFNRAEAERQRQKAREERQAQMKELVDQGVSHATQMTFRWDPEEREEAHGDVLKALQHSVEPDWSPDQVRQLVEEVLTEEDPDDDEEDDFEDEDLDDDFPDEDFEDENPEDDDGEDEDGED
jgi:excisionase family DNA binding protein